MRLLDCDLIEALGLGRSLARSLLTSEEWYEKFAICTTRSRERKEAGYIFRRNIFASDLYHFGAKNFSATSLRAECKITAFTKLVTSAVVSAIIECVSLAENGTRDERKSGGEKKSGTVSDTMNLNRPPR